jgi:hypothetical protein
VLGLVKTYLKKNTDDTYEYWIELNWPATISDPVEVKSVESVAVPVKCEKPAHEYDTVVAEIKAMSQVEKSILFAIQESIPVALPDLVKRMNLGYVRISKQQRDTGLLWLERRGFVRIYLEPRHADDCDRWIIEPTDKAAVRQPDNKREAKPTTKPVAKGKAAKVVMPTGEGTGQLSFMFDVDFNSPASI